MHTWAEEADLKFGRIEIRIRVGVRLGVRGAGSNRWSSCNTRTKHFVTWSIHIMEHLYHGVPAQ